MQLLDFLQCKYLESCCNQSIQCKNTQFFVVLCSYLYSTLNLFSQHLLELYCESPSLFQMLSPLGRIRKFFYSSLNEKRRPKILVKIILLDENLAQLNFDGKVNT